MNRAITSDRKYQDHLFPLRKANYALLVAALVAAGYESTRYSSLEPICFPDDRKETECRKAEWVEYYLQALALKADLGTLPDINVCDLVSADATEIKGTYASIVVAPAGGSNDILWTSKVIGSIGNILRVAYVDPSANNAVLSMSVVGSTLNVNLATGAGGAITSTANSIIAFLPTTGWQKNLFSAVLASTNPTLGTGVVTAMAAVNLQNGSDA